MKLSFRYAIAAIVMAGALFLLSPTLMPEDVNLPGASRISLGLDLKGGVQLTLGVDTEKAVQSALINSGQVLRQKAREAGITVLGPRQMPGGVQELIIARANQVDAFLALAKKDAPQVVPGTPRTGSDGAVHLPYSFTPAFVKQTQDLAVDQVLRTISSRIDQFGVAEPDIRKQQGDRILIQLPGLTNVNRAVQLVEKSADLSFHLVRDDISQGYLPPGVAFYPMTGKHGEATNAKLALDSTPLLSGKEVADARPGFDNKNTSMVSLSFTPRGAALFEMATGEHVGKRLAIVLDGTIHSAPVIQEKIAGGTASISGQFTPEEAQDLAISLRSGSLAAPVHVLEQRTVGPALGEASITSGILAALIGTLAVMIIMPLRYGWSGMLANGMLLCTLSLLMGGMAALGATLTLPGIAGVVLTIGMAVDANVLIFERIREELALGLTPPKAIKAGFERANLSIVEVACPTYPLWEQIALPLAVKRLGADLLHCTSNTAPLCCPVPLVLTLHDIIYLEPRQQRSPSLYQEMGRHYRRLTVPRILKKCRKIITVSHFERNRIREALNIPADRITTIYNGYSRHFRPMDDINMQIVNRYIPQKDFLFFLGNTDPKKNTARVLKAYSLYLEKSSVRRPLLIADLNETYIDSPSATPPVWRRCPPSGRRATPWSSP